MRVYLKLWKGLGAKPHGLAKLGSKLYDTEFSPEICCLLLLAGCGRKARFAVALLLPIPGEFSSVGTRTKVMRAAGQQRKNAITFHGLWKSWQPLLHGCSYLFEYEMNFSLWGKERITQQRIGNDHVCTQKACCGLMF